jgi:DNA invertase Pin-like site-specific DNA recombinase
MDGKFVAYYRVSTDKQGKSGLGLKAQKQAVAQYLNGGSWKLAGEYEEVESGKRSDRPKLEKALAHCKVTGATLIVAKLDRLSRDAHFLGGLLKAKVPIIFCDLPDVSGPVGEFLLGMMAQVAQLEARMIAKRTKDALEAVKAKIEQDGRYVSKAGRIITRLGNPNGAACLQGTGNIEAAGKALRARADGHAERLRAIVEEVRAEGALSTRALANALNKRGIRSANGKAWYAPAASRLLVRLGISAAERGVA